MPHARDPIAWLDAAVKRHDRFTAPDGVDLRVQPGELLARLGPSRAGKTTAIELLSGLIRADAGTVDGLRARVVPPARCRCAVERT